MNEASLKSSLKPSSESLSATSSLVSEVGPMLSSSQDGQIVFLYGLDHALVSPSPWRESRKASVTQDIFGLSGSGSSESLSLQSSLASRLRALLDLGGSKLFKLTWKERVTPSGLRICALRARALHTSGSDSGGSRMPTPTATDWKRTPIKNTYADLKLRPKGTDDLAKWALRESGIQHGRLVPDLWRWAMGFPPTWAACAPTAMPSSRKSRPRS